ncbi:MAG TPA: acyl carrier protein [Chitinophagales bacterium]|nr:acyl carrier protein [Chitinophagales bacterium]
MLLEEFTKKFAECFNQTDPAAIKPETEFRKLEEWGSMMALIVIATIDADFGKTVTSDDLKNANTVADLFGIVKNK